MSAIAKLFSISSQGFSNQEPKMDRSIAALTLGEIGRELFELLSVRNGFYAFEQALQVYSADKKYLPNLIDWNAKEGWRSQYGWIDNDVWAYRG